MYLKILILILQINAVIFDSKKDKGMHRKAKVINAVILLSLSFYFMESIRFVFYLLRRLFDLVFYSTHYINANWEKPVGIISGNVHLAANIIHIIIGCVLFYITTKMITRNINAVKLLTKILPVCIFTETIFFYRGWIKSEDEFYTNPYVILTIGAVFYTSMCALIIRTYTRKFMLDFYNRETAKVDLINELNEQ